MTRRRENYLELYVSLISQTFIWLLNEKIFVEKVSEANFALRIFQ
jgi:hypothetical protein